MLPSLQRRSIARDVVADPFEQRRRKTQHNVARHEPIVGLVVPDTVKGIVAPRIFTSKAATSHSDRLAEGHPDRAMQQPIATLPKGLARPAARQLPQPLHPLRRGHPATQPDPPTLAAVVEVIVVLEGWPRPLPHILRAAPCIAKRYPATHVVLVGVGVEDSRNICRHQPELCKAGAELVGRVGEPAVEQHPARTRLHGIDVDRRQRGRGQPEPHETRLQLLDCAAHSDALRSVLAARPRATIRGSLASSSSTSSSVVSRLSPNRTEP